jgi:hypothetical protein
MKKSSKQLGQYLTENHDYNGNIEEFLEETAPLIGFIVHSFNSLDSQLNSTVCSLITDRTDGIGAIILYKMNFSSKIDLLYRLVRIREVTFGKTMPTFTKLIDDLKKCATLRNAVVHAEWENLDSAGFTYVKMSFEKNGMQQHYWQFTPDALSDIIDFIDATNNLFETYEDEFQDMNCG